MADTQYGDKLSWSNGINIPLLDNSSLVITVEQAGFRRLAAGKLNTNETIN